MHTSDEEMCISPDEANEPRRGWEPVPAPLTEFGEHYLRPNYADLSDDPGAEEPGCQEEHALLTEFEGHYLRPSYADSSDDPDAEEPGWKTNPAALTEFEED